MYGNGQAFKAEGCVRIVVLKFISRPPTLKSVGNFLTKQGCFIKSYSFFLSPNLSTLKSRNLFIFFRFSLE